MYSVTRFVFLFALCTLLFAGCDLLADEEESQTEPPQGKLDFETLVKNQGPFLNPEPFSVVLTDEAQEEAFLDEYTSSTTPDEYDLSAGYSEQLVVAVSTGGQPSRYTLAIDSIVARSTVTVYATETGDPIPTRYNDFPHHIVTLWRSEVAGRDIEFAEINRVCLNSPCHWEREE